MGTLNSRAVSPIVAFNEIDEACLVAMPPELPFNIEIEFTIAGRIQTRRLRAAIQTAMDVHPMASARWLAGGPFDIRNRWQLVGRAEIDPLSIAKPGADVRGTLLGTTILLERTPPFRLSLAHLDGGDRLTMSISHLASDGIGAMRLLRSIARAYAGEAEPPERVDPLKARSLEHHFARPGTSEWLSRMRIAQKALDAWRRPPVHMVPFEARPGSGESVHHVRVPAATTSRLRGRASAAATLNDLLLVGLVSALRSWNHRAGVAPRPSDRIALAVPLNLRPRRWWQDVMANLSVATVVTTPADGRTTDVDLLREIVTQTTKAKADLLAAGLIDLYRLNAGTPAFWKRGISRVLAAMAAPWVMPTAVLSNLGHVDDEISFGRGKEVTEVWFSPPCRAPTALAVGVVRHRGALFMSFRYRRATLSAAGAEAFGEILLGTLTRMAEKRFA